MVMVAFQRAGCDLQLGPSQSFVDWSATTATAAAAQPPAAESNTVPPAIVDLQALWSGGIQSFALAVMLIVSLMVGAAGGAVSAIGSPEIAAVQARTQLAALAQGVTATPEQVAAAHADVDRTLASVESHLGAISEISLHRW